MAYHTGRLFKTPDTIDEIVAANFEYLSKKIQNGEVWNPTLKELVDFLSTFEATVLDLDAEGKIVVAHSAGIPNRPIS
jgi:DNA-binding transcriptional regulator/RsmH inhibitor MraZ